MNDFNSRVIILDWSGTVSDMVPYGTLLKSFLAGLKKAGLETVIVTAKSFARIDKITPALAETGLAKSELPNVLTSAMKDEPILLQRYIANHLGRDNPTECIVVDDDEKNIKAAQSLGMKTIKFNGPIEAGRDKFEYVTDFGKPTERMFEGTITEFVDLIISLSRSNDFDPMEVPQTKATLG